jgi:hypothetical protein
MQIVVWMLPQAYPLANRGIFCLADLANVPKAELVCRHFLILFSVAQKRNVSKPQAVAQPSASSSHSEALSENNLPSLTM